MKELHCSEVGFFPDCEGTIRGETEEEVMAGAAQHGREVHDMTEADFTEENVQRIRASIHEA